MPQEAPSILPAVTQHTATTWDHYKLLLFTFNDNNKYEYSIDEIVLFYSKSFCLGLRQELKEWKCLLVCVCLYVPGSLNLQLSGSNLQAVL